MNITDAIDILTSNEIACVQQTSVIEQEWIKRRVYKDSVEYSSYLSQRFADRISVSFEFAGHRWRYEHTSFDDRGDYDVISRPPCALLAQPVADGPTIPSHYRGHEIAVYRDGFHAGYKEALASRQRPTHPQG